MVSFEIHQGVKLNSTGKQLLPFTRYATDKEDEIKELRGLQEKFKLCTEFIPKEPEKKGKGKTADAGDQTATVAAANTVDSTDDISLVNGVGAATENKL